MFRFLFFYCIFNYMKKEVKINLLVEEELRNAFKIACIKNGTSMTKSIKQHIQKTIEENK